jgi:serine protease AprX
MQGARNSVLWGKRKERTVRSRLAVAAVAAVLAVLALPSLAFADAPKPASPDALLSAAKANPTQVFPVIVESSGKSAPPESTVLQVATQDLATSVKQATDAAAKAQKNAADLASKAAKAAADAAKARQDAATAAAKATASGKAGDVKGAQDAAQKADAAAAQAATAQAAADQAGGALSDAQAGVQQAQSALAQGKAQTQVQTFSSVPAVSAQLSGSQIVQLSKTEGVLSVVPDAPVTLHAYNNNQSWPDSVEAHWYWGAPALKSTAPNMPTISVVDSGIDNSSGDFDSRLLGQVDFRSDGAGTGPADGRGHGTLVATLAAGGDEHHSGVAPRAKLVSLKVIGDDGSGRTSDVIRAADWILANKDAYNIRVANFSLNSTLKSSFLYDPLDQAVERLWRSGVVVVTASGNYGSNGQASGVLYAPANDPFVVTVGASDTMGTNGVGDDTIAPWSAFGYTIDGFAKPELAAPGRYMIGASPAYSSLSKSGGQNPKLVAQGYLQLSGTSFSAGVVSGAAAALLGLHPDWTPDLVKGALMITATDLKKVTGMAKGVGELNLKDAFELKSTPPNPNQGLNPFLVANPNGGPALFDGGRWLDAVKNGISHPGSMGTTASWSAASWSAASWSAASWSAASWSAASWSAASWSAASWSSASWSAASWSAASWSASSIADNAALDGNGNG